MLKNRSATFRRLANVIIKSKWELIKNCINTKQNNSNTMKWWEVTINKISRLISKKFDMNEYINKISSYRLSFFEKVVMCRGLKFSLPQKVSPTEVLEPSLKDPDKKELASSTLFSIALNYIQRTSPNPPKALVKALIVWRNETTL